jgi:hypothetical protein
MKTGLLAARCLALLGAAVVTLFFAGCAPQGDTVRPGSRFAVYSTAYLTEENQIVYATHSGPPPARREEWVWNGDGILGAPAITIDLGSQTAYFYKGGQQVGRSPVSTGREGYGTPTGNFKIIQKNKHHVSNLYGDYVDGAGNVVVANVGVKRDRRPPGTTFRGAPMPFFMRIHGGVGMHAGYLPGYPASHGCIRLPRGAAQRFFENAPVGTPVRVVH